MANISDQLDYLSPDELEILRQVPEGQTVLPEVTSSDHETKAITSHDIVPYLDKEIHGFVLEPWGTTKTDRVTFSCDMGNGEVLGILKDHCQTTADVRKAITHIAPLLTPPN